MSLNERNLWHSFVSQRNIPYGLTEERENS